jgi:hypothetical protein
VKPVRRRVEFVVDIMWSATSIIIILIIAIIITIIESMFAISNHVLSSPLFATLYANTATHTSTILLLLL